MSDLINIYDSKEFDLEIKNKLIKSVLQIENHNLKRALNPKTSECLLGKEKVTKKDLIQLYQNLYHPNSKLGNLENLEKELDNDLTNLKMKFLRDHFLKWIDNNTYTKDFDNNFLEHLRDSFISQDKNIKGLGLTPSYIHSTYFIIFLNLSQKIIELEEKNKKLEDRLLRLEKKD